MTILERAAEYVLGRTAKAVVSTRQMSRQVTFTSGASTQLKLTASEQRWTASSVAYRCITSISSNASSLRLQVMRSADETEIEGHWLSQLWAQPNPLLSGRVFGEYLWQRMETKGETFVYLDRGESGTGTITAMWPIFGDVTVVVDKNLAGEVVGYVVDVGGRRVSLLASEVLWLRYPDAENEWGCMAPLRAASHAIGLDAHARAWQQGELVNGARPSSVVYLGDLDEEQHEEIVDTYRSRIEGPHNSGRTLFVSSANAAKVERMSLTPAELGWLDTRRNAWEEVLLAFGVSKDYLLGGATHENRDAARSTLWSDTIIPKLEVVAGELARQLLPPAERARFDTDDVEALQESADGKANRTNAATSVDIYTLDEARAEYGLDPLPNGLGTYTLTAYRTRIQLEAQSALLVANGERQLQPVRLGEITPRELTQPFIVPKAQSTRAGLSFDQAQAEYAMHERVGVAAVKRLAGRQEQTVLNNLHKLFGRSGSWAVKRDALQRAIDSADELAIRASVDDLMPEEPARDLTRAQLEAFLTALWQRGSQATAASLGVDFNLFDDDVLDAMDARAQELALQVTSTTRKVLEDRVLLEGVANGETIDELAARVRSAFTDLSTWRAVTIARTETVGGFNASSYLTAQSTDLVTARVWLATGDTRTRDSHIDTDNERVLSFSDRYSNGCLHPGNGPAAEVIMCRCVEQYETD